MKHFDFISMVLMAFMVTLGVLVLLGMAFS
jgi:hypothetical protein